MTPLPGTKIMEQQIQPLATANIDTNADGAHGVYVADMDGDGDMDIVSASQLDDTIAWYENNGAADPTFTAADIVTNADAIEAVFCCRYGWRWRYGYYFCF